MLLKLNPAHKKVPVLVHQGKAISESLLILEYLDEMWKDKPLLSTDPFERAMARFWAQYSDEKLLLGVRGACMVEGEAKEKAVESLLESLAFLEELIHGKKFFGGEEIGFLDVVMGWIPIWLGPCEEVGEMKLLEAKTFPFLFKWAQNFIQIPFISDAMPPRDKLVSYIRQGTKKT